MNSISSTLTQNHVTLSSGSLNARFLCDERGWYPEWVSSGDTPLWRFKDHEWLSLGRVVSVGRADGMMETDTGGLHFSGREDDVMGCGVEWAVEITPTGEGWFRVETRIMPDADLGLVEVGTFFETPYDYDGSEYSTVVSGANPATVWDGENELTPPVYQNPNWCYSRPEASRMTYRTHHPMLVHKLTAEGLPDRYVSLVADFRACSFDDMQVTPTRTIDPSRGGYWDFKQAEKRGYKYILGAGNWTSSHDKDPVFYLSKSGTVQVVEIQGAVEVPSGSFDRWLMRAWDRAYALNGGDGSIPEVDAVYRDRDVSWRAAGSWLQQSLLEPGSTGMGTKDRGPIDYLKGTRPIADYCYGDGWRFYPSKNLLPGLDYRLRVLGGEEDLQKLDALQQTLVEKLFPLPEFLRRGAPDALRSAQVYGLEGPWVEATRQEFGEVDPVQEIEKRVAELEADPDGLPGLWMRRLAGIDRWLTAESWPVFAPVFEKILDRWESGFWTYTPEPKKNMFLNGGQAKPYCLFDTARVASVGWAITGEERYLEFAARFVNLAVGWSVHTFQGRNMPEDLDLRGMSHGAIAGRDQQADIPPTENEHLAKALWWIADVAPEKIERGWLDAIWMMKHTSLCQYPKARSQVRVYTPEGWKWIPGDQVASHQHLVETVPYFGYENPVDQTLIATYQSLSAMYADLYMGGVLADAGPEVLTLVPRVYQLDRREITERRVLVYNPGQDTKEVTLKAFFPDVTREQTLTLAPHGIWTGSLLAAGSE